MIKRKIIPVRTLKHSPKKTGNEEAVRFVALGGLEEIGRNMSVFEYKDEIIVFDAGIQFPEEDTPGIDYIIPNTEYLEANKHKIKALIVTHAHYDHIGAIPYVMGKIGNPTIYTTALAKEVIKKRQDEFTNAPKINFEVIKNHDVVKISENFELTFFGVLHNIPDTVSILIKTPVGNFVYSTDVKFDYDEKGNTMGLDEFAWAGKQKIHTLFLESTGAEKQGLSPSELLVIKNIEDVFKKTKGRLIIGTFSSMLTRLDEIIRVAEKYDRKVFISGFSMKTNIQICQNLGYMKIKKGTIVSLDEIHKYKDDKILVLSTGAQGEPNASLMKIVNGEHRQIQIKAGDSILFSSSVIAGNERAVQVLKDNLTRQGAKVYHSNIVDFHASGHATGDELKQIVGLVKPQFFLPIHGLYFMRAVNVELAHEVGLPKGRGLIADNGQIVKFRPENSANPAEITEETVPAYYVMVDGLGVGDVGEVVLRDRLALAQEGMVVIISTLDRRTGRFLKNPDIISRGFIYLKENKELVEDLRKQIRSLIGRIPRHQQMEQDYVKALIRNQIGQFLYRRTKRRPMILPVVIEV
ncbi:ribonuclease J [Candidatus Wolfebacteria bacterium]|nr:ribonuclease J [Candidatus Wolfebacteria bacterium]